jgi:hypothetical protein
MVSSLSTSTRNVREIKRVVLRLSARYLEPLKAQLAGPCSESHALLTLEQQGLPSGAVPSPYLCPLASFLAGDREGKRLDTRAVFEQVSPALQQALRDLFTTAIPPEVYGGGSQPVKQARGASASIPNGEAAEMFT